MKFNKWILLLLMNLAVFTAGAQNLSFPVSGSFVIQHEEGNRQLDFNKVQIQTNTFTLFMNEQSVRSYKIESEFKGGFHVEQFFQQNESPSAEIEKFNVRIEVVSENECYVTIIYPVGSERLHLIKLV